MSRILGSHRSSDAKWLLLQQLGVSSGDECPPFPRKVHDGATPLFTSYFCWCWRSPMSGVEDPHKVQDAAASAAPSPMHSWGSSSSTSAQFCPPLHEGDTWQLALLDHHPFILAGLRPGTNNALAQHVKCREHAFATLSASNTRWQYGL